MKILSLLCLLAATGRVLAGPVPSEEVTAIGGTAPEVTATPSGPMTPADTTSTNDTVIPVEGGLPFHSYLSTYCTPSNECTFGMKRDLSNNWNDAAIYDKDCKKIGFHSLIPMKDRLDISIFSQLPYVVIIKKGPRNVEFLYANGAYKVENKNIQKCSDGFDDFECTSRRFNCNGFVGRCEENVVGMPIKGGGPFC